MYRELMRQKLLEDIYDKMTDDEKRLFVQLTLQNRSREEIIAELQQQNHYLVDINNKVSRQTWLSDFSSNIAGNAVWDGLVWLGTRLLRRF